ncbi:hypothetical protein COL447_00020 [Helicobacter pylori]
MRFACEWIGELCVFVVSFKIGGDRELLSFDAFAFDAFDENKAKD